MRFPKDMGPLGGGGGGGADLPERVRSVSPEMLNIGPVIGSAQL